MSAGNQKRTLAIGLGMMAAFTAVLVLIFMPLFSGKNGLDYLDNLFNSISKGSAYYIPKVKKQGAKYSQTRVDLKLVLDNPKEAARSAKLLKAAGAEVKLDGAKLTAKGNFGQIVVACLVDADDMFKNRGQKISGRYGQGAKLMVYTWWKTLSAMERALNRAKKFGQATYLRTVRVKAVECAYNFYGIKPEKIGSQWLIVVLSLAFYVFYTMWFGFAVLYIFEGTGFRLEH